MTIFTFYPFYDLKGRTSEKNPSGNPKSQTNYLFFFFFFFFL